MIICSQGHHQKPEAAPRLLHLWKKGWKNIINPCPVQCLHEAVALGRQGTQHMLLLGIKPSCPLTDWQPVCPWFGITIGEEPYLHCPIRSGSRPGGLGGTVKLAGRRVKQGERRVKTKSTFSNTQRREVFPTRLQQEEKEICGVQNTAVNTDISKCVDTFNQPYAIKSMNILCIKKQNKLQESM